MAEIRVRNINGTILIIKDDNSTADFYYKERCKWSGEGKQVIFWYDSNNDGTFQEVFRANTEEFIEPSESSLFDLLLLLNNIISSTQGGGARDNFYRIKNEADLADTLVGGEYLLDSNGIYEINGTVLMTRPINLNNSVIYGLDKVEDKLVYTPISGSLFQGLSGGEIRNLSLSNLSVGSTLFNLIDLVGDQTLLLNGNLISNCSDIGLIKGYLNCTSNSQIYLSNTAGITYEDIDHLTSHNHTWFSSNKGTFTTLVGAFEIIDINDGFSHDLAATPSISLDITGIVSISESAICKTSFVGDGTHVNGTFTKEWEVQSSGIPTETDDVANGDIYISTAIETVIGVGSGDTGNPIKVLGTTTAVNLFRTTMPSSNRITYEGTQTRTFSVTAAMTITCPANNKVFIFHIAKNGVITSSSAQSSKLNSSTDVGTTTVLDKIELAPTDYIELWVENITDTTNITIEYMNLSIS